MAPTPLSQRVAAEIERRILSGALRPGERLPTGKELSEMLGVSRSVVRDAVQTLVGRGLVTSRQGSGTVVAETNDSAIGEGLLGLLARSGLTMGSVVRARATLETQLARHAAEVGGEEDWASMQAALDRMRKGVEEREWAMVLAAHVDFHLDLIHACGQPALDVMLRPIEEVIMISSLPPVRGNEALWDVEGHAPILDALTAGDPDAVEQAMNRHFEYINTDDYREFRTMPFAHAGDISTYREYLVEPWRRAATTA